MIQLDERLGSMARQHVEHEGKESFCFLSHFKVVTYLDGKSLSTGDKGAVKAASMEPRLYMIQVTGKKKRSALRLVQVSCCRESLYTNNVFILNVPAVHSWLWRGYSSNLPNLPHQCFCPSQSQNGITDSSHEKDMTILEEGINDGDDAIKFWKYLSGGVHDKPFIPTLYKICDDKLEEIGKASKMPFGNAHDQQRLLLPRSMLKGDSAYLFDTGSHIFIWWGVGTVGFDKQWQAFPIAHQYFEDFGRPALPVTVVKQHEELPCFSKHFHHFTKQAILAAKINDKDSDRVLYQIKGTLQNHSLRLSQVPCRRDSLNEGDAFVLTVGETNIWLWQGCSSNADERKEALKLANSFASQRGLLVSILDQGQNDDDEIAADFWKQIFPSDKKIKGADGNDDNGVCFVPTLIKMCSGQDLYAVVRDGAPFHRSKLTSDAIHLLDTGFHVFVWWGYASDGVISDRWKSFLVARQYFRDFKRPILPITILLEGNPEPDTFGQYFQPIRPSCSCCCTIF